MTSRNAKPFPVEESWDAYWRGTGCNAAFASEGRNHPMIQAFWDGFFRSVRATYVAPKIIDVASGNGAVIECVKAAFDGQLPDITCLDHSAPAIRALAQRFPDVHTIVGDACDIPLDSGSYDIATSQFGIEYAGLAAAYEVARLVAPGGRLAFLLHDQAGSIYQECAVSLNAVQGVQRAGFIPYASDMFKKGFAACQGADRAEYEQAARKLAPAVRVLESIVTRHGAQVAGGLVTRLYDEVGTIHEQIQRYAPSEVLNWLNRWESELQAFQRRMASMCAAAIDKRTFDGLCGGLRKRGYTIVQAQSLVPPDQERTLAWVLTAIRD